MDEGGERAVARTGRRELADEWALVLLAEGLSPALRREAGRWAVSVPAEQAERAVAVLAGYARESRPAPEAPPAAWTGEAPLAAALAASGALLLFHRLTGDAGDGGVWFEAGRASARAIQGGEAWRAITALTLHADAPHVLGNALAGAVVWTLVGRALGPGVGALAVLAAGAGGNLANALLRAGAHLSVGASTAVFGAVGILGGLGGARRRLGMGRHPGWVYLAACLGLLAMLGTGGGRTDVWAHGFGVAAGLLVGAGVGRLRRALAPPAVQLACAALAALVLAGSWGLAWRDVGPSPGAARPAGVVEGRTTAPGVGPISPGGSLRLRAGLGAARPERCREGCRKERAPRGRAARRQRSPSRRSRYSRSATAWLCSSSRAPKSSVTRPRRARSTSASTASPPCSSSRK